MVANRWIDNTAPDAVSVTILGAYLRASVTLQSTWQPRRLGGLPRAPSHQKSPAGTNTWTTACTGSGHAVLLFLQHDHRRRTAATTSSATATDAAGNQTTSSVVASRVIDNTAPGAANIQAPNGGATANRPDAGPAPRH